MEGIEAAQSSQKIISFILHPPNAVKTSAIISSIISHVGPWRNQESNQALTESLVFAVGEDSAERCRVSALERWKERGEGGGEDK